MTDTDASIQYYKRTQRELIKALYAEYGEDYMEKAVYKLQKPPIISVDTVEFTGHLLTIQTFYTWKPTEEARVKDYESELIDLIKIQQSRKDRHALRSINHVIEEIKNTKILHRLIRCNLLLNAYTIKREIENNDK